MLSVAPVVRVRYMRTLLERSDDQFARQVIKGGKVRPASNPSFGNLLERSWSFIFDCDRPVVAGPQGLDEDVDGGLSRRLIIDDTVLQADMA
jgi:hypothetical protein